MLLVMALTALVCYGCSSKSSASTQRSDTTLSNKSIKKNIGSKIIFSRQKSQKKLTQEYSSAAKNSNYTLASPYIKVNPYETSPLTALITFKTNKAAKVTYTVQGKSEGTSITNTVNGGYTKKHQVPVVGLYANYSNRVTLHVTYKNGKTATKNVSLKTGDLPTYIKRAKIRVSKKDTTKISSGHNKLTLMNRTTKEPFAVDSDGQVRWYSTNYSQHTVEQWSKGRLMILTKEKKSSQLYNDLIETDWLGRVYKEYSFAHKTGSSDGGEKEKTVIHHDLLELPNHNILATVSDGSKYKEDILVEISHKSGKVVKIIDFKKILPKSMWKKYKKDKSGDVDWLHQNSVDYDSNDHSIVISSRNQDLIMKLDYNTKKIKWIYSGKSKKDWPRKYRKYLLKKDGNTTITGGQHGLYILKDVNSDASKTDILLYNNNIAVTNGNKKTSGKYSEAVQYRVDAKKMTIKQTWSYGKDLGQENFTPIIGYAEKQSNGNYLITFGYKKKGQESNIIEVTPDGKQVFNLTIKNPASKAYVYRAYRIQVYNDDYVFDAAQD